MDNFQLAVLCGPYPSTLIASQGQAMGSIWGTEAQSSQSLPHQPEPAPVLQLGFLWPAFCPDIWRLSKVLSSFCQLWTCVLGIQAV